MTNEQIKNNIDYIKVLLALNGIADPELDETLEKAREVLEKESDG